MNDKLLYNSHRLINEIRAEMILLSDFSDAIEQIKAHIKNKNWIELEKKLKAMNSIADNVQHLEQLRNDSFCEILKELHLPEKTSLLNALPEFDYDLQQELSDLHFQLKMKVYKVKIRLYL